MQHRGRRPCGRALQHLVRSLLDVRTHLYAQCETTQNREQGKGASLFSYPSSTGKWRAGRPSTCACHRPSSGRSRSPRPSDERFVYLSDVLPTAWQGVEFADVPDDGSIAIFGLGPIGQMAARIAKHRGHRVIAVDLVPERLAMAERYGVETVDLSDVDDAPEAIRELTDGRGTDSVLEAVGMEAHGARSASWPRTPPASSPTRSPAR